MSEVELTEIREGHEFDERALHLYMQRSVEGYRGPFNVLQFEGGQSNPTFLIEAKSDSYVMRKQPPGKLLPSAHAVHREYRVMKALWESEVPVPRMFSLCEDAGVLGTKFYVMEMVQGRLFSKTALPDLPKEHRRAVYLDMTRVLAELHKLRPADIGLERFGRTGNYYARQIDRWSKQYVASETETIEAMNHLMRWLPDNIPDEVEPVVVHGDYRLGNILLHETEPAVVAVLDWELSTLGDGLADLSYWCLEYHGEESDKPGSLSSVDIHEAGIPSENEIVRHYCDRMGVTEIDNWLFYAAYNLFRSAGIIQGVYKRGLDGNASSTTALQYANTARLRAELGWRLVHQMNRN